MRAVITIGLILIVLGTLLLVGDSSAITGFAQRHGLSWASRISLVDLGQPRYRRYLAGAALIVMGLILVLLGLTGHRFEP